MIINNQCGPMYRRQISNFLLVLLLFAGTAAAEVVYVDDYLRLGVRTNPDPAESSIAVVTTGEALTVLGREGDYIKIRTEDGTEGWVSKNYVSDEPPARRQLEQLRKEYEQKEAQSVELSKSLAESTESRDAMDKRITELMTENSSLQQEIDTLTGRTDSLIQKYAWAFRIAIAILLFLTGFYLGAGWHSRRVRRRLGGMEI